MPGRAPVFRRNEGGAPVTAAQAADQLRGSARERGYTAAWDNAAKDFKRHHPLCVGCLAVGLVEPATLVDHVIPHKGDQTLFWDKTNWQSGCDWHHNVVKKELERLYRAGEASAADMRFDSQLAMRLTRELTPPGG